MSKLISSREAADLVKNGATIANPTFGLGGFPQEMYVKLAERFEETQSPRDLTVVTTSGIGTFQPGSGLDIIKAEGLIKRLYSGHIGSSPLTVKRVIDSEIESYLIPQGVVTLLYREIAAKRAGLITKVGLRTYIDPRIEGAKANDKTTEDLISVIEIGGEEYLHYHPFNIDVAIIRGTFADEKGNISQEQEASKLEHLALATAAKNSGGIVIAQVKGVVENGQIKPKDVLVPGALVDYYYVADPENHYQTMGTLYKPELSGEIRVPLSSIKPLPLNERKIIARRAAMMLRPNSMVNFGIGMPDGVGSVASEEGVDSEMNLTLELGIFGGVGGTGLDFGAAYNPEAIIDMPSMFDFYDGGGLDLAVLGIGEIDQEGNNNVTKFGPKVPGPGGFVNISQNTKDLVFVGTFAVGGKVEARDGKLVVLEEPRGKKFVKKVAQISFSGKFAEESNQRVLYITERAVFDLHNGGLRLIEIAPGIDLEKDILKWMEFEPQISENLKEMNPAIFNETWGGLAEIVKQNGEKE